MSPEPGQGRAAARVAGRGAGGKADGLVERLKGLCIAAKLVQRPAAARVAGGALGIQTDGLVERGKGIVVAAEVEQRLAAARVALGIARIQADGLVERGKGVGVAIEDKQRRAAARVAGGAAGIQADGLVERGKGVGVAAEAVQGHAAARAAFGVVRGKPCGLVECGQGFGRGVPFERLAAPGNKPAALLGVPAAFRAIHARGPNAPNLCRAAGRQVGQSAAAGEAWGARAGAAIECIPPTRRIPSRPALGRGIAPPARAVSRAAAGAPRVARREARLWRHCAPRALRGPSRDIPRPGGRAGPDHSPPPRKNAAAGRKPGRNGINRTRPARPHGRRCGRRR